MLGGDRKNTQSEQSDAGEHFGPEPWVRHLSKNRWPRSEEGTWNTIDRTESARARKRERERQRERGRKEFEKSSMEIENEVSAMSCHMHILPARVSNLKVSFAFISLRLSSLRHLISFSLAHTRPRTGYEFHRRFCIPIVPWPVGYSDRNCHWLDPLTEKRPPTLLSFFLFFLLLFLLLACPVWDFFSGATLLSLVLVVVPLVNEEN